MIVIGNMKSLNIYYDELWFIMRSMDWFVYKKVGNRFTKYDKKQINERNYRLLMQPNVHIVDDLSPEKDLYTWYLLRKQNGEWNENTFLVYSKTFIRDIVENQDAIDRLNELWTLDKQGKTILLVCACQEEHLCHRSIIAGILHGVGCNVVSAFGTDISQYDKYYDMYREREKFYRKEN